MLAKHGYPWPVLRRWQRPTLGIHLVLAGLVLATMVFGPHGVGTLVRDDGCACDASGALADIETGDCTGFESASGEERAVRAQLGGEGQDDCPPGCDCPCCGSPVASAQPSRVALGLVGSVALRATRDGSRDAAAGEQNGVFRPPRA